MSRSAAMLVLLPIIAIIFKSAWAMGIIVTIVKLKNKLQLTRLV